MNNQLNFVHCHQIPERSFFFKGKQFPLCARCTGIQIGYLSLLLFVFKWITIPLTIALIMTLPTIIDGLVQAYLGIKSNNPRRLITGILAGVGIMSIASELGQFIGKYLKNILTT